MILLYFLGLYQAGISFTNLAFIYPDQPNPIVPYRNNENSYAYYDFFVSFSSRIASNGVLYIVWPNEFPLPNLALTKTNIMTVQIVNKSKLDGIPASTCAIRIFYSAQPYFCATFVSPMTTQTLAISFPGTINAGSYQIRILYNLNPVGLGGKSSGYFQLYTKNNGVLQDQNLNFGTLGFAPVYTNHSTGIMQSQLDNLGSIINDGSNLGGYTTNYVIIFTTTVPLATNSWFRAEIPYGFDISSVSCVLMDTLQDLSCTIDVTDIQSQKIFMRGISAPLAAGSHQIKLKNIVNPVFSGQTNHFIFETLVPYVNTVVEYYYIVPVSIVPGQIINPSIAGSPLNQNLRIQYTIQFTPQDPIPVNGKIVYTFPPGGFVLDPTCQITQGLSQIGTTPISCVASNSGSAPTITITQFAAFLSQQIQLTIYATNPGTSNLYQPCTITTYSDFGVGTFLQIDQNLNAGSLQISSIQSPLFVAIDMYVYMVNLTLSQVGPIDFRLYPMDGKHLPLSTAATSFGEIMFQLPLWWRMNGQNFNGWNVWGLTPTCNFGADIASTCSYYLQYYTLDTPSTTNYLKYLMGEGLAACDLPISLAQVIVTPIPGRWDFRVLTMKNDHFSNFATQPLEQDLYTMEIAVDPFPWSYIRCTSGDQVDNQALCYASFSVGLSVPYEGAINMNMSTINSTYQNSAAWPNDLGFNLNNDSAVNIPCTVVINGQTMGFAGTPHPKLACFAFSGGLTRLYAVLQVRGFSSTVSSGSVVQVFFPDMTSCTAYNLNCYITLTTSWTTNIDVPYTLNTYTQSIAFVVQGSVSLYASTAAPINASYVQDLSLSASFSNYVEICRTTTWSFQFTLPSAIQANRDYILIKMPRDRFPYSLTGASSNAGTVYIINNFRKAPSPDLGTAGSPRVGQFPNYEQLYYFIIVTNTIAAGTPATVTLGNVRNAIDPTPGVITNLVFWINYRRQRVITFPISSVWQNGGIINPTFQILPKTPLYLANRVEAVDMDFDSDIVFQASFQICRIIPANGMVEVQVQGGLTSSSATCNIWTGITAPAYRLGWSYVCNLATVSGNKYYQMSQFNAIPSLTQITISYTGHTQITVLNPTPAITITTYLDAATRTSNPSLASNTNDYYNSVLNGNLLGIPVLGPNRFPLVLQWQPFLNINNLARQGTRGEFYMTVTSLYTMQGYNSNPNNYMEFQFNTTGIGLPPGAQMHCRVNGNLAKACYWSGGLVTMYMPLLSGITANVPALVSLSTRGADYSATTQEGLSNLLAGRYQVKVTTYVSGQVQPTQFTYKVFDVLAPAFLGFWVWGSNKIGVDPQGSNPEAQKGMYRIYLNNPTTIPASNDPNPATIIVQFDRINWPTFTNGFQSDLGTGLNQKAQLPCIHVGFNLLPGVSQLACQLSKGTYPSPTQVIITNFSQIPAGTNMQIHIPSVWGPNTTYELTQIAVIAQIANTLTGNTQQLLQNQYQLINYTFGRTKVTPGFNQISIDVPSIHTNQLLTQWPAATAPTFAVATIDTMTTLSLNFGCFGYQMGGGADMIQFELLKTWPQIPYGPMTCSWSAGGSTCFGYPYSSYVAFYLDSTVAKNTLVTGTISMKTPPYKTLVPTSDPPIRILVYTRSKLVEIYDVTFTQVLNFVPITPTVTCYGGPCYLNQVNDFIISWSNPKNIPSSGAITIIFPTGLAPKENGCRNDVVGGSTLSQAGFVCSLLSISGVTQLQMTGFSSFVGPGTIQIRVKMLAPAAAASVTGTWDVSTWYLVENPFNKLVTQGSGAMPSLVAAPVTYYWDTPYRSRVRARTTLYGSLEFRINLATTLAIGSSMNILFPSQFAFTCAQWLCIWDITPWYDNHNDDWIYPASSCLFNSGTLTLTVGAPLYQAITAGQIWRLIVTTQNSIDGTKAFLMPTMGTYQFTLSTTTEKAYKSVFVPQLKDFTYYECFSLITNAGQKNMFSVRFTPTTTIPANNDASIPSTGFPTGGYLILSVPTLSVEGAFLFANDLGTGFSNNSPINCYGRTGFTNPQLSCQLRFGNQLTGTPAQIIITAIGLNKWTSLVSSSYYIVEIDQFYNPSIAGDDKHIEIKLESFSGVTLLDQGFSYDFTVKPFTPLTATLAAPSPSTNTLYDLSLTYTITINSNMALLNTEFYYLPQGSDKHYVDYYIFEFTKPYYASQPQTLSCSTAGYLCTVSQGHNWVIIVPTTGSISGVVSISMTNVNNPAILPLVGIVTQGYAVKGRIMQTIYTYAKIVAFPNTGTPLMSPAKLTATQFVVTAVDYVAAEIPNSALVRFEVAITIGTTMNPPPYGSVFDLYLPTGFTPYDNCYNNANGGSQLTFTQSDNLLCTVYVPTANTLQFMGQSQIAITGFDAIPAGNIMKVWIYALTPATSSTGLSWNLKVYQDTSRAVSLFDGTVAGPNIAAYTSYSNFEWVVRQPATIKAGDTAPFSFQITMKTAPTASSQLVIQMPPAVTVPVGAVLYCTIQDLSTLATYEFAYCIYSGTLTITMQFPVSPTTFVINTWYAVTITSRGSGILKGLTFSTAGVSQAQLTIGADSGTLEYEVLPTNKFTNANIRIMSSKQADLSAFLVTFTTTVAIPQDGFIVVSFPLYNYATPTATYFTALGTSVTCYSQVPALKSDSLNCQLRTDRGQQAKIEIVLSSFPATVPAGTNVAYSIEGITIPYNDNSATIPLALYTTDNSNTKLEALTFYDWVSPVPSTVGSLSASFTFTITSSNPQVQNSGFTLQFTANTGGSYVASSYIAIGFPAGYYDLYTSTPTLSANTGGCGGGTISIVGNYLVYAGFSTSCAASMSLTFSNFKFVYSAVTTQVFKGYLCQTRVCSSVGSTTYSTAATAVTSSGTPTVTIPSYNVKPYNGVQFTVSVPMTVILPIGAQLWLQGASSGFLIDKVIVTSGFNSISRITKVVSGANYQIQITLGSDYAGSGNIQLQLFGHYQTTTPISISVLTRYLSQPVIADANAPIITASTAVTATIASNGYLIGGAAKPGTSDSSNIIYLSIPTISTALTSTIYVYIDDISYYSGSCTAQWIKTITASPTCSLSSNVITVGNVPLDALNIGEVEFYISGIAFGSGGYKAVTVVVQDSSSAYIGSYSGFLTIFPSSLSSCTGQLSVLSNDVNTQVNMLQVTFQPPSAMDSTLGSLFLEISNDLIASTATTAGRQLQCALSTNTNTVINCSFNPRFRLSQTTTTSVGYSDTFNHRILISGFSLQSSASMTFTLYFDFAFTANTYDGTLKYFTIGYYTRSGANNEQLQFGETFLVTLTAVSSSKATATATLSIAGTIGSTVSKTLTLTTANIQPFNSGDYIVLKFLCGYSLSIGSLTHLANRVQDPSMSSDLGSSAGTSSTDIGFFEISLTGGTAATSTTLTLSTLQLPQQVTTAFATCIVAQALHLDSSRTLLEAYKVSKSGDTTVGTLSSVSQRQISDRLFEIVFQSPLLWVNQPCGLYSTACTYQIKVVGSTSFADVSNLDLSCTTTGGIIQQSFGSSPGPGTSMPVQGLASFTAVANGFTLPNFWVVKANQDICMRFLKGSAPSAGSTTFTISIFSGSTTYASVVTTGISVLATGPSGVLAGIIKSQFGWMDYNDYHTGIVINSQGYLVFQFGITVALPTASPFGYFQIYTTSLGLSSFNTKQRLKCFFRNVNTQLPIYSPQTCAVDTSNQLILVTYSPPNAGNRLPINTKLELLIKLDQVTQPLFIMPSTASDAKFTMKFFPGACCSQTVPTYNGIVYASYFNYQSKAPFVQTQFDHSGSMNSVNVKFTTTAALPNTGFIQVEFPLVSLSGTLTQTAVYAKDLGTSINGGWKINCLDTLGNLGLNYKCNLYYGITTQGGKYSFIRLSGQSALGAGAQVSFNIMNFKNPASLTLANWNLRLCDDAGNNYEFTYLLNSQYVLPALALSATTSGTLSMSTNVEATVVTYTYTVTTSNALPTNTYSSFYLKYNAEYFNGYSQIAQSFSGFTATVNGAAAVVIPQSKTDLYVIFPSSITSGSSVSVAITAGLRNPNYYKAITNIANAFFISYQTKNALQSVTQTITQTTTTLQFVVFGTITSLNDLQKNPLGYLTVPFTNSYDILTNYVMKLTLYTDYALTLGQYCAIFSGATQISTSCTSTSLVLTVTFLQDIPSGTALSLGFQVYTASTAQSTFSASFFADSTATYPIWTGTTTSPAYSAFTQMTVAFPYLRQPQELLQDGEVGPMTFTWKFTSGMSNFNDYAQIDSTNFLTTTNTIEFPVAPVAVPSNARFELVCMWNNLAASNCVHYQGNNTIQIWRPLTTTIAAGDTYTLTIQLWRYYPLGSIDFTYQWHKLPMSGTNAYKASTVIVDVQIKTYTIAGSVIETQKKTIATQNYRFDDTPPVITDSFYSYVQPYWPNAFTPFFAVHQATINTYTTIEMKFRLIMDLPAYTNINWGQLILSISTQDDFDTTAAGNQFPDGAGAFTTNNNQVDCICNNCPTINTNANYATNRIDNTDQIAPLFQCFLFLGFHDPVAPIQIWINPLHDLYQGEVFDITIPNIKLPPSSYTYAKFNLLAYDYTPSTGVTKNHSEIVHYFTVQTIPDAFVTTSGINPPTLSPNLVGAAASVTWQINNPFANMLANCHDRWVLTTTTAETKFEHPYNPNVAIAGDSLWNPPGIYPFNYMLYTTATNHRVVIYPIAKWITFQPTTVQVQSATQTLNVQNFKNMPYRIQSGVDYQLSLFITVGIRQKTIFNSYATSPANTLVAAQSVIQPVPAPALTLAPQEWWLTFLPYNKIPAGGYIVIWLPHSPAASWDWQFTDAYCTAPANLVNPDCIIDQPNYKLIIRNMQNAYDPNLLGTLTVKFNIINPSAVQATVPFSWSSYYDQSFADSQNFGLIDQNTNYVYPPGIQGGGTLVVTLWTSYQAPYTICGGRTGPLTLSFTLRSGTLTYPNDWIALNMEYAFTPSLAPEWIICYFSSPTDFTLVNIKSHRCDWNPAGGGVLTVYIPEEIDIVGGVNWLLTISTFSSLSIDGWTVTAPSNAYWVLFYTSTTTDKGWFQAQIPGCPFSATNFLCENIDWEASNAAGDPSWTIFNLTAQTLYSQIPAGDPSIGAGSSRFLFSFLTQNELQQSWPMDLTHSMSGAQQSAPVACNGLIRGNTKPLQPQGNVHILCQNIIATGNAWNNTPSYIIGQYYQGISTGQLFNFQIADFANGYTQGTFQHILMQVQVLQPDGTFYNQQEHYCWHQPYQLLPTPNCAGITGGSASASPTYTQVNLLQQWTYFSVGFALSSAYPGSGGDAIVFDYDYPYTLPLRGYCQQRRLNVNYSDGPEIACTPQHLNGWFVLSLAYSTTPTIREAGYLFNPPFVYKQTSPVYPDIWNSLNPQSTFRAYVYRSHQLIANITLPLQTPTTGRAFVVLQTTSAQNPVNTFILYHVGIYLQTYDATRSVTLDPTLKHLRIWGSSDFQAISSCTINRGLTPVNPSDLTNPIQCTITSGNYGSGVGYAKWLITIDNFAPYQGDGWIIVDLMMKNPATPGWTQPWFVKTFESATNLTYVMDETKSWDGRTWVGEVVPNPNLYRVYRNTISYEGRRAQTSAFAEMHLRIIPYYPDHPPTTSSSTTTLQVWLPLAYGLTNGGTPVCSFSNTYHTDLTPVSCKIDSNRVVTLTTDNTAGMHPQCSLITVTTTGAIGGNNGFVMPSTPQSDQFQVFLDSTSSTGVVEREYNYNSASPAPQKISSDPTFSITSSNLQCTGATNQQTIITVTYTAPLDIPAGYSTGTGATATPVGTLQFKFNTRDKVNYGYNGFAQNLGQTGAGIVPVLCQAVGKLTGTLSCMMTPSQAVSVNYPAIILVTGFDYIYSGTLIQISFINIVNGLCSQQAYYNDGNIKVSAYQTNPDGTQVSLIMDTPGYGPLYNSQTQDGVLFGYQLTGAAYPYGACTTPLPHATITPSNPTLPCVATNNCGGYVGQLLQFSIANLRIAYNWTPITITYSTIPLAHYSISAGDQISIVFPTGFEFPASGNAAISGTWNGIQMITTVYAAIQTIYFTFPPTFVTQTTEPASLNTLIISQVTGPAYVLTSSYSLTYSLYKQDYLVYQCTTDLISPPSVSMPSTSSLALTSQYSGDINVGYTINFSPSYTIPAGSTVTVQLPNRAAVAPATGTLSYSQIGLSNPPATCTTPNSVLGSCTMTSTSLTFTTTTAITAQTPLSIQLTGVKNPSYVGMTIPTDYQLSITNPSGQLINQGNFAPFNFLTKKIVGVIYMKLEDTNNFEKVKADYTFVIQNTNQVPSSGSLQLYMPVAWASTVTTSFTINSLTASWTSQSLAYSIQPIDTTSQPAYYILSINNQFVWPAGGSLTILMLGLINPAFTQTQIFQFKTFYDGVNLDSTDPNDLSLVFKYNTPVPSMGVSNFTMSPSNEGEVSTYSMTMTTTTDLTNGTVQLQFPSSYPAGLTTSDLSLNCQLTFSNGTLLTVPCSAANQRLTVNFTGQGTIATNTTFTLSVIGVVNPNIKTSPTAVNGTIDVITSTANGSIATYTSGAATILPSAPPSTLSLVSLSTDSTNLQVKANYTFCISTTQTIPLGAQVFMTFPKQFTLKSSSYQCFIGTQHNNVLLPYTNSTGSPSCSNTNSLRQIAISGHTAAYPGSTTNPCQMCYIIQNIENPTSAGPTDNFVVSIYNPSTSTITQQTFGTLSPNDTLTYAQQGLVITVASIAAIPRYISSPNITVTLQQAVTTQTNLTPISTEFQFSPATLVFNAGVSVLTFTIHGIAETATTPAVGQKSFSWTKSEGASPAKFSEMADSFFQYIDTPIAGTLTMTVFPIVFRVALGGTSLPISLTLSQPAAYALTLTYNTIKPSQDSQLVFNTTTVTFPAGSKVQYLTYTTLSQALSGQIQFQFTDPVGLLYTIINPVVSFEILQTDTIAPVVINYYGYNIGTTTMQFRASINESVQLYYQITAQGSPVPSMSQILKMVPNTNVYTAYGNNGSYQSSVTSTYIYNDVYLALQGLNASTPYTINFFVQDLSGNNNSQVLQYNFTTLPLDNPSQFQLTLTGDVSQSALIAALALSTGLPASRFKLVATPPIFSVNDTDAEIQKILSSLTTTYTIEVLPDDSGVSPTTAISMVQNSLTTLNQQIPQVVVNQNVFSTAFQVTQYPQEFKYTPVLLNYTDQTASFKARLRYSGFFYAVVLPSTAQRPTGLQIQSGLNATNYPLAQNYTYKAYFNYSNASMSDDQVIPDAIFTFTMLFDNTNYTAYMIGQNVAYTPTLMPDNQTAIIKFQTLREVIIIPKYYQYSAILSAIFIMII